MKISLIWRNMIPAVIILAVLVFSVVRTRRDTPENPPIVTVIKKADLTFYWNRKCKDTDATVLKLKPGDSLQVLGYGKPTNHEPFYWVETTDGQRGCVLPSVVDTSAVAAIENIKAFNYQLTSPMGPRYISKAKFEKLCQTKTPAELEDYFDKSMTLQRVDSGVSMFFNVAVLDPETGIQMRPKVSFPKTDAAGASDIQYKDSTDRNAFFLETIPLAGAIVDVFHVFIDESYYWYSVNLKNLEGWKHYLSFVLIFGFGFFWLYATCFLLGHIVMALIPLRYPFKWLGNYAVRWVVTALIIITLYIWTVLMLTWGAWWWAFLPVVAFMAISFEDRFMRKIMEQRCPHCKSMDSYTRVDTEFVDEALQWCTESEYDKLVSSNTERWQTWTETVWKMGDGSYRTDKHNVQNHSRTTRVHQYNDFKVLYLVKHYCDTYECDVCGAQYEQDRYEPIEQSREYVGSHQTTSVSEN